MPIVDLSFIHPEVDEEKKNNGETDSIHMAIINTHFRSSDDLHSCYSSISRVSQFCWSTSIFRFFCLPIPPPFFSVNFNYNLVISYVLACFEVFIPFYAFGLIVLYMFASVFINLIHFLSLTIIIIVATGYKIAIFVLY